MITLSPELLRAIEAIVGAEHVSTRETDRLVYSVDAYWMPQLWLDRGGKPAQAAAIVSPGSVDEIAQLLAIANQARVPVVPWGGGSGTQGGALPIHGGLIVDVKRLNRIVEISEQSLFVKAQAGINGTQL